MYILSERFTSAGLIARNIPANKIYSCDNLEKLIEKMFELMNQYPGEKREILGPANSNRILGFYFLRDGDDNKHHDTEWEIERTEFLE